MSTVKRVIQNSGIHGIFFYLGKNSLALLLFSPIFSIFTKQYGAIFSFNFTHLLCTIFSLVLVIALSMLTAYIFDKTRLPRFIMGANLYQKYAVLRNS